MEVDNVFFIPELALSVGQISKITGCHLNNHDNDDRMISRVSSIEGAQEDCLVFISSKKYISFLSSLTAGAIFCTEGLMHLVPKGIAILISENPLHDFSLITMLMHPNRPGSTFFNLNSKVSEHAFISNDVTIEQNVQIGPGAVINQNVIIGKNSIISPNAIIGEKCTIGENCYIGPGVCLQYTHLGNNVCIHPGSKIGQDGFGYVSHQNLLTKIPQIGMVIIADDVEIGANTTIDRGFLTDTVIGKGTKIDNQVQIGHNVKIGKNCVISAQGGISGTVHIGDNVMLGGRVGIADHITVGDGARIFAASGVMRDIPAREKWGGIPAQPVKKWFRSVAMLEKITNK